MQGDKDTRTASTITWLDPVTRQTHHESGVALPWLQVVQFPWYGSGPTTLTLTATATTRALPALPQLSCLVEVDEKPVPGGSNSGPGLAFCTVLYADPQ